MAFRDVSPGARGMAELAAAPVNAFYAARSQTQQDQRRNALLEAQTRRINSEVDDEAQWDAAVQSRDLQRMYSLDPDAAQVMDAFWQREKMAGLGDIPVREKIDMTPLQAQENWAAERSRLQKNDDRNYNLDVAQFRASQARQGAGNEDEFAAIADPVSGQIQIYNKRTGQIQGQQPQGGTPLFNPGVGMKPTDKMKNDLTEIQQQRGAISGALGAVNRNPNAFGFTQGALERFGGDVGTAFAQWKRNPEDSAARAFVYNNVSSIINQRAGAAQSVQELQRLRTFLPSETDDAAKVEAKFNAFLDFLDEQEAAIRGYSPEDLGYTPRTGAGPRKPEYKDPAAAQRGEQYLRSVAK